jgi:type III secretory pathway lipoprotein EscJ
MAIRALRAAALALALCACSAAVRSGVREHEADAMILLLDEAAIAATKERGQRPSTFEVHVPRADLPRALHALRSQGQLNPVQPGFADVLGVPPLVPTPTEERDRRALALAGELARTIEQLSGVTRARVHLSPPPRTALDAPPATWRASVVVQRRAGQPALDEASLRSLVQGAVDPLPAIQIAIVQTEADAVRQPEWARLGPFTVAKRDAPALRATLAGTLALNVLSSLLLIAILARKRARGVV